VRELLGDKITVENSAASTTVPQKTDGTITATVCYYSIMQGKG